MWDVTCVLSTRYQVPAASDSDRVGQRIAGNGSGFISSLLSRQKRSDSAENPDGPF